MKKINILLTLATLVASIFFTSNNVEAKHTILNNDMSLMKQDSLFNPFVVDTSKLRLPGFVHCGNLSTLQLPPERAIEAINQAFEEEGVKLQKYFDYKKDGVAVKLDGYNKDLNIGYLWLDHLNMGEGMRLDNGLIHAGSYTYFSDYVDDYTQLTISPFYFVMGEKIPSIPRIERWIGHKLQFMQNGLKTEYSERLERIKKMSDEDEKLYAYKVLYLDMLISIFKTDGDRNNYNATQFFESRLKSDSDIEAKESVLIEWTLHYKIEHYMYSLRKNKQQLQNITADILKSKNEEVKKQKYNDLIAYFNYRRSYEDYKSIYKERVEAVLTIKDEEQMLKSIQKLVAEISESRLSYEEARQLVHPKDKYDAIAIILPKKFMYPYSPEMTGELKEKLEEIQKFGDRKDRYAFEEELREISCVATLERLQAEVRRYIQWVKQQ